jgi:glycosyltransferase involved in cell wall biosynthesis
MRILIAHNRYQQAGGEDTVFTTEAEQLAQSGMEVERFEVGNEWIQSPLGAAKVALSPAGLASVARQLAETLDRVRPDVVHFHNIFPLIGASGLKVVASRHLPTVVTLHNYRLLCANAMLMRKGRPCTLCVRHSRFEGIRHRCYRHSVVGSAAVTLHTELIKRAILSRPGATTCIALTNFARHQLVDGGLPNKLLRVKANSVSDLGAPDPDRNRSGLLYVGRLSSEKGVDTLIDAADHVGVPLTIIGHGPLEAALRAKAGAHVRFLGVLPSADVRAHMRAALAVALPSTWFEGFPMTIVEAMEAGTMVIASEIGSLPEIVTPDMGMLAQPGDPASWSEVLTRAFKDADRLLDLGMAARRRYDDYFSPSANVRALTAIYADVRSRSRAH